MQDDIKRIKEIIEQVKPRFTTFGGDIEFVDVMDNVVRIRPRGYCHT